MKCELCNEEAIYVTECFKGCIHNYCVKHIKRIEEAKKKIGIKENE